MTCERDGLELGGLPLIHRTHRLGIEAYEAQSQRCQRKFVAGLNTIIRGDPLVAIQNYLDRKD